MLDLCSPALLYFIMAILCIIVLMANQVSLVVIMIKMVFVIAWTWVLNFFCNKGYSIVSWIFVITPFIATTVLVLSGNIEELTRKTER